MRRGNSHPMLGGSPAQVCQNTQWPPRGLALSCRKPATKTPRICCKHGSMNARPQVRLLPAPVAQGALVGLLVGLLLALPLLLSLAPRSLMAHDEGYYALQGRWILDSGDWLAPRWWSEPLYDRTVGLQWLIAASYRLFGVSGAAAHLPGWLSALAAAALTRALSRSWLTTGVLVLTPLWFSHAHLAGQDMPLLALELLGIWGLWSRRPLLAGAWLGPAFLVKGFMALLPALALLPLLLLERRALLRQGRFWAGLILGWLPPLLWLGLSLEHHGLAAVGQLWGKLLWLSRSDTFAPGPFYYFWNIPANTAPWGLIAPLGWALLWRRWRRGQLQRDQLLLWIGYPLLLLLLLTGFRTKTPYYPLQLTPFIAFAAAEALQWVSHKDGRLGTGLRLPPLLIGGALIGIVLIGGLVISAAWIPLPPLGELPLGWLLAAALALGICWLASAWQPTPRRRLIAWLLGPYLALVCLLQGGVFIDHSPALRQRLAEPAVAALQGQGPVHFVATGPLNDEAQKELILLALAAPQLGTLHSSPETVPAGVAVWRHESGSWQLQRSPGPP